MITPQSLSHKIVDTERYEIAKKSLEDALESRHVVSAEMIWFPPRVLCVSEKRALQREMDAAGWRVRIQGSGQDTETWHISVSNVQSTAYSASA